MLFLKKVQKKWIELVKCWNEMEVEFSRNKNSVDVICCGSRKDLTG